MRYDQNGGHVRSAEKPQGSRRQKRGHPNAADIGHKLTASQGTGQYARAKSQRVCARSNHSAGSGQYAAVTDRRGDAAPAGGGQSLLAEKPLQTCCRNGELGHALPASSGQTSGAEFADIIEAIVQQHRFRRHAIKTQQKLDRALESLIRRNFTDWSPSLGDKERDKANKQVIRIIAEARKPETTDEIAMLVRPYVNHTDQSRAGSDALRMQVEKERLRLVKQLPVAAWLETVKGAGLSGLADIIGEAGDLGKYETISKLYKRLGFAPYEGLAGSTWKRETWRPRALTKEEWIANPFSGERYGIARSLADSMFRSNWIGKNKSEDGVGKPSGHYGELYARRRAHTKITHDDWSDGHAHSDALRYMFKKFLRDLWNEWRKAKIISPEMATVLTPSPTLPNPASEAMPRLLNSH